jgi:hypothetical protein
MPFFLDSQPSQSELSEAVNYLLSNFTTGLSSDVNTGQIIGSNGVVIGYLYQYLSIKYADSFDGTLNFSDLPTNRQYYGLRNNNSSIESNNPADYIWTQATGGFGVNKYIWYQTTGGRAIQLAVATSAPDVGWLQDSGYSINLDIVTSATVPVIVESFVTYFAPSTLQVPRTGSPLTPVFTNITPVLFATDQGTVVPYSGATTDSNVAFVNNSWRIGNSSTTGLGDISYSNITIGNPTDAGDYAIWPEPTAMPNSPAFITVPVRYKNSLGVVSQASVARLQLLYSDPGATGPQGVGIDISGYTAFVQNAGGAFTPTTATLSALLTNVTAPTYSWSISGATPTTASTASVVITPTSSSTGVAVTLTVNGTNLLSPISKTINLPVVYDGAPGQAGSNGVMSAFPSIYLWTGSSTPPTRPSTTSTYTWATGAYTAPAGWSTTVPSNTTAGNYLWEITIPLNVVATTTTSTLDWTNTTYTIRAIAFNGINGTAGSTGAAGAATFVITRVANDSSAPTNVEVSALLGRNPVDGDICTVSYNNFNNAVVYRYVTSWVLFSTYITGSLIVQNTITGDKIAANTVTASNINSNNLTIRDGSGNILFGAGTNLSYSNINPAAGWLNSGITLNSNGTISGAGGGAVTVSGLDNSIVRSANPITTSNISTYIATGAIQTAYIGDAQILSAKIADAQITTAKIVNAAVNTLQINGNAVTVPTVDLWQGSYSGGGSPYFSTVYVSMDYSGVLFATVTIVQAYSSGFPPAFQLILYINNNIVYNTGTVSQAWQQSCTASGGLGVPAGNIPVTIAWVGSSSTAVLGTTSLYVIGAKR